AHFSHQFAVASHAAELLTKMFAHLRKLVLVGFQLSLAVFGNRVDFLVALLRARDEVPILELLQDRVHRSGARRIEAMKFLLDRFDDVVAVPRPLLDDFKDDHVEMAAHKAFSAEAATPPESHAERKPLLVR